MQKEIKYSGFSAVPSDYECPDGEMAAAINLIPEEGALHPVAEPDTVLTLPSSDYYVIFIHKTSVYTHYIIASRSSNKLWWLSEHSSNSGMGETLARQIIHTFDARVTRIQSVGNVLAILSDCVHYVIWKDNNYVYLGTKVPHPELRFPLKLNLAFQEKDKAQVDLPLVESGKRDPGSDENTEEWSLFSSNAYRYSNAAGDFSQGYTPSNETLNKSYITTGWKPLPSELNFQANVSYKLKWTFFGVHYNMGLWIGGKKSGADEIEPITSLYNDQQTSTSKVLEKIFESSANYTSLYYAVNRSWSLDNAFDTQTCYIELYKGTDNSESSTDEVDYYMSYNETSFNTLMGMINAFVAEKATDKAGFIFPFFIRYAVRLYDGSYSYVSPPALMIPNSDYAPAMSYKYFWGDKEGEEGTTRIRMAAFVAKIQYILNYQIDSVWKGIIDGIDIFVTPPIWLYKQSEEYNSQQNRFSFASTLTTKGYGRPFLEDSVELEGYGFYAQQSLHALLDKYFTEPNPRYVKVAARSKDDIIKDVESISNFYRIATLSSSDIFEGQSNVINDLKLEIETLASLQARPTLPDDVLQYQGFKGNDIYLYSYNNRLHICNSDYILPEVPAVQDCLPYFTPGTGNSYTDIFVYVETEQGEKIVERKRVTGKIPLVFTWYFYHYSKATKVVFISEIHEPGSIVYYQKYQLNLRPHPIINGTYWFSEKTFDGYPDVTVTTEYPSEYKNLKIDPYFNAASTIYISEVNNPFIFRSTSVVVVGSGKIIGICSAARPLSQGQFGQFPLYAFTDEGVWALEVSFSGTYLARQPITRDVCINPNAICQIDSAVLFPTARGIMLISGSQVSPISDVINSEFPYNIVNLPNFQKIINTYASSLYNKLKLSEYPFPISFSKFLADCQISYDYPNQRIYIFNPSESNSSSQAFAYVFSLKSKQWAIAAIQLASALNSYPDAMAMTPDGKLINLSINSSQPSDTLSPQLLVSRPFKLDAPDVYKTIDTIIQRGYFRKGHIKTVLYGSRDLFSWHLIWSSQNHFLRGFRGTPFKYFRVALICNLSADESIYGATVQYTPKLINQPR